MARLLFGLTGSIACFKACSVLSKLVQEGHEVQVLATESALRFVGLATLEGLSRRRAVTSLWDPGTALDHIELTKWADAAVVCPVTANTLAKLAAGLADDPLCALHLAWPSGKPSWILFPAMNGHMWSHPATRHAVSTLRSRGVRIESPDTGAHACGDDGDGRLPEPEEVLRRLREMLA